MHEQHAGLSSRAAAAMSSLGAAVALERSGNSQGARELCASALHDVQPLLARRCDLLQTVVHALPVCEGFRLLSRLVLALTGRKLQVLLLTQDAGSVSPPRYQEDRHGMICPIDRRWLARLTDDDPFLRRWCDALVNGQAAPAAELAPVFAQCAPAMA